MTTSRAGRRAFTLLELLFVIIIIGVLASVSFPGLRKTFNRLQLDNTSRELQSFMNYLEQRSLAEGKLIYLNIDLENSEYWAKFYDSQNRIHSYAFPAAITLETDKKQVKFFPDGQIEPTTIRLTDEEGESVSLTTEGVFGRVKIQE